MKSSLKKLFCLCLFTILLLSSTFAADAAATTDPMTAVLCNIFLFITGGVGQAICAFVIIGVGIGFFTGKVSWGVLIGVALGIASLFGGPAIMQSITGSEEELCSGSTVRL